MRKQLNRLAASASVIALGAVGAASALSITSATIGTQTSVPGPAYSIANELNLTGINTILSARLEPTTGSFPIGNVFLHVTLGNATFPLGVSGSNVAGVATPGDGCTNATASISSGGGANSSGVIFLVSNAHECDVAGTDGLQFTATVRPSGAGSMTLTMNVTTDVGGTTNVDGGATSATVLTLASGFTAGITADAVLTQAALPSFTAFSGGSDKVIGAVQVALASNSDFVGTPVDSADLESVTVTVTGDMSAYATGGGAVFVDLDNSGAPNGNEALPISGTQASRVFTAGGDLTAITAAARSVRLLENGTTPIQASTYNVTIVVNPLVTAVPIPFKADDETVAGALQSVTREGTQVTLPWFASQTQQGTSQSQNLVRIGNLNQTTPVGAVYANVLTSNLPTGADPFVNPGNIQLDACNNLGVVDTGTPMTIPAGGSVLINSACIETQIESNWGTGDVQITVEAPPATITARRLINTANGPTELGSGTVLQDQN